MTLKLKQLFIYSSNFLYFLESGFLKLPEEF